MSESQHPHASARVAERGFNDMFYRWASQLMQTTDQVGHEIDALTLHWIRLLRLAPQSPPDDSSE